MQNDIKKIVKLKDTPVGNFDDIVEQTLLISPNLMPRIIENTDICHGFGDFLYFSTGYYLPNKGASSHPHENIDIVNYIIEGGVKYTGTLADGTEISQSQVQVQRTGKGINHTEINTSNKNTRFIQMWFSAPSYQQEPDFQIIDIAKTGLTTVLGGGDIDTTFNNLIRCQIGTLQKGESIQNPDESIVFIIKGEASCGDTTLLEGELAKVADISLLANTQVDLVFITQNIIS